jgi:glutathione S-transferase
MGVKKLILAMMAVALTGCATLGSGSASEKLVVQVATMKFIEAGDDRAAKAARIVKAAAQARVWLDMDGVTIADLHAAMMARINGAELEPSDKLLAAALVDVVVSELNVRIGNGIISPEKRATVNAVLSWVEQAASFYAG